MQEICISGCDSGYYEVLLTPEYANTSTLGDLELGTDVCLPCDGLCVECTGPGIMLAPGGCQNCTFAVRGIECVEQCNTTIGEHSQHYN